jgi:hypothetical protein
MTYDRQLVGSTAFYYALIHGKSFVKVGSSLSFVIETTITLSPSAFSYSTRIYSQHLNSIGDYGVYKV